MSERRSPLAEAHEGADASMTDFGGWAMPVEFDSIRTEHAAVREAAGKFDVSHMSQVRVTGPDSTALTQRLVTNDVTTLDVGDSLYAAITDEDGIMLEDTIVYRLPEEGGEPAYLFVPNAGNDAWATERWIEHRDAWDLQATVENETEEWGMIAVQGPEALDLVDEHSEGNPRRFGRFTAGWTDVAGVECWLARTGYTGEDGVELIVPWNATPTVWNALECQPCGLGARDTLRMEAGYLLSGQDFDAEVHRHTPYEARIGFTVKLDTDFVGRDALERQHEEGVAERLVGIRLVDRGVPRSGYPVTTPDGDPIGEVTSGTMSPTLDEPIGLGYLLTDHASPGTSVRVEIRDRSKKAKVESLPFVDTI